MTDMVTVRAVHVEARRVFNLASPRFLPELSKRWQGVREWWSPCYEPVRDLCERRYIELFDKATGHYERLEADVRTNGFRNPVMLSAGRLERRKLTELPPDIRERSDLIACEYVGGSRLLIAAKLGLLIPAIVNDYAGVLPHGTAIKSGDTLAVMTRFKDLPRRVIWRENGSLYANHLPYTHYPAANRINGGTQSRIRRQIVNQISDEVDQWRLKHDNA